MGSTLPWFLTIALGAITGSASSQHTTPSSKSFDPNEDRPWKHRLPMAAAKEVAALESKIADLEGAGNFAESAEMNEKVLAKRLLFQPVEHWEVVRARWRAQELRLISKQPPDVQKEMGRDAIESRKPPVTLDENWTRQALARARRVLGEESSETATWELRLGLLLRAKSNEVEGMRHTEQCLKIRQQILGTQHPDTALAEKCLGECLARDGYEAAAHYEEAARVFEYNVGPEHPEVVNCLSDLATVYLGQKQAAKAKTVLGRVIALSSKINGDKHLTTLRARVNIAIALALEQKYSLAEPLCRQVLQSLAKDAPANCFATTYETLALALEGQGRTSEALPYFQKAIAFSKNSWGEIGGRRFHLGMALEELGKYDQAEEQLVEATRRLRMQRLLVGDTTLDLAAYCANLGWAPLGLTVHYARRGQAEKAWECLEAFRACGLLDVMVISPNAKTLWADRVQYGRLLEELDRLDGQPDQLPDSVAEKRERLKKRINSFESDVLKRDRDIVYPLERVQRQIPEDAAMISWARVDLRGGGGYWACVVRRHGNPIWVSLEGNDQRHDFGLREYSLTTELYDQLSTEPSARPTSRNDLVAKLGHLDLEPLEPHLRARNGLPDVKHVIVLQVGRIPFEVLTDRYQISYAPSASLYARMQEKKQALPSHRTEPTLLALADPAFETSPEKTMVASKVNTSLLGSRNRRDGFASLAGTRAELEAICSLFSESEKLLGANANSQRLKQLASSGELGKFRYLHFATHGVENDQVPFESALLLADGPLTAKQLFHVWGGKLDADLVTLSACDTGLGVHADAEDYLGFAHVLFLTGARSVVGKPVEGGRHGYLPPYDALLPESSGQATRSRKVPHQSRVAPRSENLAA
jgi:tetratricopeptide (TPR) repeat protein